MQKKKTTKLQAELFEILLNVKICFHPLLFLLNMREIFNWKIFSPRNLEEHFGEQKFLFFSFNGISPTLS